MKNHIKHIGTFLLYTFAFNVISFVLYFLPAFANHNFEGSIYLFFGIIQLCFTMLVFRNIPMPKTTDKKGVRSELIIYFIIISILSVAAAFYRWETGNWSSLMFFNTFFSFTLTSFLDELYIYIIFYLIENIIKTYFIYKRISKPPVSKKQNVIFSISILLSYFVFIVLSAVIS